MNTESIQPAGLRMEINASYRIQVQGSLDSNWSNRMGGLKIIVTTPEDTLPYTTLSGDLIDQAALMGVLDTLYDLRMPILSVQCLTY